MSKYILFTIFALISLFVQGQPKPFIPLMRKIFHENVDRSQRSIDKIDRKEDRTVSLTGDPEINMQVTYSLINKVDEMQDAIEADSTLDGNGKIKLLRGLNEVLSSFESAYRIREFKIIQLPDLINAYQEAIVLDRKGLPITPLVNNADYGIANILIKCIAFQKNVGIEDSKSLILLKTVREFPKRILPILLANPTAPYADSLLTVLAKIQPDDVYDYAQSFNTDLGKKIQANNDPLVKTIVRLANLNEGRMYFPFLDNLSRGKVSVEEIDKVKDNEFKYYRFLVNTQIDYSDRMRRRDTPLAMDVLTGMLRQKAVESFINVINGLHDSPDNIRMKKVESLNPQELYFLCVMGETEIYTSSYLKVYQRIFQRMKNANSDTLLLSVNFDHFKKFIKMAANYNTLDDFLKRMNKGNAEILMRAFASGLEKTGNLEDAVDVADSYASISDKNLQKLIVNEIQTNLAKQTEMENKRGIAIYDLLGTIFQSLDTTNKIDLSEKFGIPPIYSVSNNSLKDSAGKIVIMQLFYGDKDGAYIFSKFKTAYTNANWKIVNKPEWIEVTSTKGTPVVIYANKPLDETLGLDEKGQEAMNEFMRENDAYPTITIHRGHSYHVSSTIGQLFYTTKVVLLGSCGGYQNINKVLSICPYAHIIASKQVGSGTVNEPMIINITETLRSGKDLYWPEMWKKLSDQLKSNALFEDYIPPYKNLGALFIMAYNQIMES